MAGKREDPFYSLKVELDESVNDLNQKMTRFHGLQAGNPERRTLSTQVDAGVESVRWQLEELAGAVDRAAGNPAKFNLTNEELTTRRRWIDNTNKTVGAIQDALKKASAAPAAAKGGARGGSSAPGGGGGAEPSDAVREANAKFVGVEAERQTLILRQQDEHLDDIEAAVSRIGNMGRNIGEELDGQSRLLNDLGEEMDTTYSRLRAAQKRMAEVIRSAGSGSQFCMIIVLVVVLMILMAVALS